MRQGCLDEEEKGNRSYIDDSVDHARFTKSGTLRNAEARAADAALNMGKQGGVPGGGCRSTAIDSVPAARWIVAWRGRSARCT